MKTETPRDTAKRLVNERAAMNGDAYSCDLKLVTAIEAALSAERERCAKIADSYGGQSPAPAIAAEIRGTSAE